MKCLVIDDEPRAIRVLENYIEKVPFLELVGTYREALKAMDFFRGNPVDLIFLDINMPDLTGMQFLKSLARKPLVIFTTAYPQYALESYEYDAVDFLLKPIEFERFLKAVNKASRQWQLTKHKTPSVMSGTKSDEQPDQTILVKSGTGIHQVKVDDILYVEGAGNYVNLVMPKRKIMSPLTMKEALGTLPAEQFVRVHKSYIVNLKHISLIEKHHLQVGNTLIPIGRLYRQGFLQALHRS